MQGDALRLRTRLCLAVLPPLLLLLAGEIGARVYYFRLHHSLQYLLGMPRPPVAAPVHLIHRGQTVTTFDPATGRELTIQLNAQGGRGSDWQRAKVSGSLRILAVGASTTFGVNNPENATWPAFLEETLCQHWGRPVEVLNGGEPGRLLEETLRKLPDWLTYQPDIVIYYEAYNDATASVFLKSDKWIEHLHTDLWLGRLASQLYYRSMLYTYLVERASFQAGKQRKLTPDIRRFRRLLQQFVKMVDEHGATPVFVLQVMRFEEDPAVRRLNLENEQEVLTHIMEAATSKAHVIHDLNLRDAASAKLLDDPYHLRTQAWTSLTREEVVGMRIYTAQVFVDALRREGERAEIQVIDPRPAFARYMGATPLFIDDVHLTDEANRLLAEEIACHLTPPPQAH